MAKCNTWYTRLSSGTRGFPAAFLYGTRGFPAAFLYGTRGFPAAFSPSRATGRLVLMPNHLHIALRPVGDQDLAAAVRSIKGSNTRSQSATASERLAILGKG